uniref:Microcephalin n=1 Tax=Chelydra serpentina TaxID=8475 RepID=A0A8C3RN02_CHESE
IFCSPGVSAYVEVWSSNRTENYSKTFAQQLLDMGAKYGLFTIFKLNYLSKPSKCINYLFITLYRCREAGAHVDESLFPAIYTNEGLPLLIKKHKCMQPKDFVEKTPENDKRLQKKLDQMAKELDIQKTATEIDIPILLFEDDGSLAYSPTNKIKDQCSAMEKRIKDMKEKRENLSPTGKESNLMNSLKSISEHISDFLNSSFDDIRGNDKYKNQKPASAESDIYVSTPRKSKVSPNLNQSGEDTWTSASVSTKSSFLQEKDLSHITLSQKIVQLEAAAVTPGNQSDSLVSSDDSINMHSVDKNIPVDTRDCSVGYKIRGKRKREKCNMKLTTSALCKVGYENEFLLAMTTQNKSSDIEEASYEDFFSPSNLKKSEMQVRHFPLQVQQKSPSAPEVSCKRDFLSHKQDRLFEGSDKQCTALIKKRKRTVQTSGVSTESDCKLTECSESTVSMTLNCMSGGVNTETAEALGSCPLNQLRQNIQKISCRTSVNSCPPATDKLIHSSENSKMQHHDALKMLVNQCAIIQVVNKLGGFLFSDDVCETTTHVVTGSPRRTLNVMLGIARGCWIVCYEWVLWSLECGHWISEEPYELSANFPAAPICRLQRHLSSGKYQQDLFSSQPVMFISLASQPPCDKLSELVQLCGGKICKTLRQAKICIGEYLGKKQPEIKYLSEKWILGRPNYMLSGTFW